MKFKKIVSVMLALSVAAAFAGCSKVKSVTSDDFIAACEDLGASEFDPDDTPGPDEDDLEDGVYTVMDSDYIQENLSEEDISSAAGMYGSALPDIESLLDPDDIEQMVVYVRESDNTDDIRGTDDIADLDVDVCVAAHIALNDAELAPDFIENLADTLDESLDIDVNELSSDEYYADKGQGYLKIHVDAADLVSAFEDSTLHDILASFLSDDMDDIDDSIADIEGGASIAVYVNGENIVVIVGVNINSEGEYIGDFCSKIGLADPSGLDSNPDVAQSIMDSIDNALGTLMNGYGAAVEDFDY